MKKIMVAIAALLSLSASCFASQIEVDYAPQTNCTTAQVLLQEPVKEVKGLGVFAYELVGKNWSEAYAWLTYSPVPQLELALGYGTEEAKNPNRLGGWVWAGKDRLSGIYLFEDGGSGPWHKLELKYAATDRVSLGYVERSYSGEGLMAEYKLTSSEKVRVYSFKEGTTEVSLIHSF